MGQRSPGMGELTQLWGRGISSDVGHGRAEGGGEVGVGLRGLQVGAEGAFHSGRPKKGAGGWTPPHPQHPQAGEGGCAPHCSQQRAQILQPGCRGTAPGHQQKIRTPPPPPSTAARSRTAAEHTLLRMALGCSRPSTGPRVPPGQRSEDHRSAGSGRTHRSESTARSRGFLPLCDGNHGCGARQKGLSRAARSGGRSWGGCGARDPPRSIPKRLRL